MPVITVRSVIIGSRRRRRHDHVSCALDFLRPGNPPPPPDRNLALDVAQRVIFLHGDVLYDGQPAPEGTATFAFWSVTGENSGARTWPNKGIHLYVGDRDIMAIAWYVFASPGGIPVVPGDPGFDIDAFNVNAGQFIDNDFVNVTTDPSLTYEANYDGWVPTTISDQKIEAYSSIGRYQFQKWMMFPESLDILDRVLDAGKGESGTAFAYFFSTDETVSYNEPQLEGVNIGGWAGGSNYWLHGGKIDIAPPKGGDDMRSATIKEAASKVSKIKEAFKKPSKEIDPGIKPSENK